jgi:DNA-directed RNA polymerase specialized sigma24 family protein
MTRCGKEPVRRQVSNYATAEDFCDVFAESMDELFQLSFLLMADQHKAEQCFVAGLEDSLEAKHVFRQWARTWAKRAITQNAIRELRPRPLAMSFSLARHPHVAPLPSEQGRHFELDAILVLGEFERFIFIMSVLEHYSQHECSLLLSCSQREVREAQARAIARLIDSMPGSFRRKVTFERSERNAEERSEPMGEHRTKRSTAAAERVRGRCPHPANGEVLKAGL